MFIALFISSNLLFAQNENNNKEKRQEKVKMTPEEKATKVSDRMKKNLSLSDDQYKQVYSLVFEKTSNYKLNKEKYKSMDKDARKELKKQNRLEFNQQIEKILNKEQYSKWQEMKSKHKDHRKNKDKNKSELKN